MKVGIKKASIYANFKGKEEIFLGVYESMFSDYSAFLESFINNKSFDILKNKE